MAIYPVSSISNNSGSIAQPSGKKQLGKDEFLEILVAQLKYQDPMSPMEDRDFIAQMAQFAVLEEIKTLNQGLMLSQAHDLIGKYVTTDLSRTSIEDTGTGSETDMHCSGIVEGVVFISGEVCLNIGGNLVPADTKLNVLNAAVP